MKRGFTDTLYFINFIVTWCFILCCTIITIFSGKLGIVDMSIASAGIPAAFAELGIHTAFVVWKAKCENMQKFKEEPDGELVD